MIVQYVLFLTVSGWVQFNSWDFVVAPTLEICENKIQHFTTLFESVVEDVDEIEEYVAGCKYVSSHQEFLEWVEKEYPPAPRGQEL